ncbi:unnamed protein product, partial [Iphiclides podalirius]
MTVYYKSNYRRRRGCEKGGQPLFGSGATSRGRRLSAVERAARSPTHATMLAGLLPLTLLLACATAEASQDDSDQLLMRRDHRTSLDGRSSGSAGKCQYEGRYFADGDEVLTHAACLRCRCGGGAISCRRRTCAPLPEPPPPRCHVTHRRDACCPELQCQDGTVTMERASSGIEEEYPDTATSPNHVCVEGGTAYSAGSAMSSSTACEQCFCLGGARRCVRPKCLPPPIGCKARPAPGACCPQKYYCDHATTKPPGERPLHDCKIDGKWTMEGERVSSPGDKANCSQCFCMRGSVRCQSLACAPPLMGCMPILSPGQCCPHQYQCDHQQRRGLPGFYLQPIIDNTLISIRSQDRAFRNAPSHDNKTTTVSTSISTITEKTTPSVTTIKKDSTTTIKVKRKTNDGAQSSNHTPEENVTTSTVTPSTTQSSTLVTDITTDGTIEDDATEQPDGSVKIMINGTINCTAELSSTAITQNTTSANDTKEFTDITFIQPRIPNIGLAFESHTYNPNDIITDRTYSEDFDENESYTINVTSSLISSLRTNATVPTTITPSTTTAAKPPSTDILGTLNISKKTKDDYDYNNYNKPTLPPSLPNLKIIPFVAADAVVDDEITSKESFTYPILERHDKYPVYYPSVEAKEHPFATRREELYNPTQFPIFLSKKVEPSHYPLSAHGVDLANEYPSNGDIITSLQDYTVTTSIGNNIPLVNKGVTKVSNQSSSKFDLQTPAISLFSPPMETEGGFIPKDPGIIDDYFPIYPTTSPGSVVPHLTTSMQLDMTKGECVTGDGRRVPEGESIGLACSVCTCAWGDLHCSQRPCHIPPGCKRQPASPGSTDLCCGDLHCNQENVTKSAPLFLSTKSAQVNLNATQTTQLNDTEMLTEPPLTNNTTKESEPTETFHSDLLSALSNIVNNKTVVTEDDKVIKEKHAPEGTNSKSTDTIEESNANNNYTQEYDEEEEDEGFSFGSVLKLLLSDSYESTTSAVTKQSSVPVTSRPMLTTINTTLAPTTPKKPLKPTPTPSPVTTRPSFLPPMNQQVQNEIHRIDHLMLGEATAIKKTTPRPATVPFKPIGTRKPPPIKQPATHRPTIAAKPVEVTKKTDLGQYTSVAQESVRPFFFNNAGALGAGLLKLAGCNIYGQMYRVGRIIAELSTPCQECRCTEIGVQCRQLSC